MNIIIPLGGTGERFRRQDYHTPKCLIPVLGKEIIMWVLESFKLNENDHITIIYNNELENFHFEDRIRKKVNNHFNFVRIPFQTSGPVETILYGLDKLPEELMDEQLVIHDGDSFVNENILKNIVPGETQIFYTIDKNPTPNFSYLKLNEHGEVVEIGEKKKISDNASIGCYVFDNAHTFVRYGKLLANNISEPYISDLYNQMLADGVTINSTKVSRENFVCLGTPEQIIEFALSHETKPLRFCFDLDNTLVTFPKIPNDYTSVEPIEKNIKFLCHLKSKGHTIIIYSSRRMLTHSGNVGKIVRDIGKITLDTLEKFGIPYDELYFGKPYANFYFDDLGVNSFDNLEKHTGFYINNIDPRGFNTIQIKDTTIIKTSKKDLDGEIYFYHHVPENLKGYFPQFIQTKNGCLEIEKIDGILYTNIYCHNLFNTNHMDMLFAAMETFHQTPVKNDERHSSIYTNYASKLAARFNSYDYTRFHNSNVLFDKIHQRLIQYETHNRGIKAVIHGDMVFSNIFLVRGNSLKFIDMRGRMGTELSIYGDQFYDYAKVYQSLVGYDFILNNITPPFAYIQKSVNYFEKHFSEKFGDEQLEYLKYLTSSLLFSLIPLHDNRKCYDYYNLIEYLI